jgi:hypothetical protein
VQHPVQAINQRCCESVTLNESETGVSWPVLTRTVRSWRWSAAWAGFSATPVVPRTVIGKSERIEMQHRAFVQMFRREQQESSDAVTLDALSGSMTEYGSTRLSDGNRCPTDPTSGVALKDWGSDPARCDSPTLVRNECGAARARPTKPSPDPGTHLRDRTCIQWVVTIAK